MSTRSAMLHAIRVAVAGAASGPIPREYAVDDATGGTLDLFVQRVREYGATALVTGDATAGAAEELSRNDAFRIGIPADLDRQLRPPGFELVPDEELSPRELDGLDAALTTCAAACAATGTLAFDGGAGQGRRALTLLPDLHVCIVRRQQIVATVPQLVRALRPSAAEGRPLVLVSGPSATSDIELQRVEGVHGPRRLVVVIER